MPGGRVGDGASPQTFAVYWPFDDISLDISGGWDAPTHIRAWAYTELWADEDGPAPFLFTTCGGAAVWLNGEKVLEFTPFTRNIPADTPLELTLRKGRNSVLVFFDDLAERDAAFLLRLCWQGTDAPPEQRVPVGAANPTLLEQGEQAMRSLVAAAKPWPRLELGTEYGFDTVFDKQTSGGSVFDYCQTIGQACDLGFRVILSGTGSSKKLLFECFRPTFDPNNRYSPKWGNLLNAGWSFADTDYANVALVQGAGEGSQRATCWVGDVDSTGADRREIYIDARDIQPDKEKGETTASQSYLDKLADRGGQKLLAQLRIGNIEFDVDDDALAVGDVLSVSLPQLGYTAMVRVADIITESQSSGTTRTIRLGTPSWHKT